jgi:hypothetical protein
MTGVTITYVPLTLALRYTLPAEISSHLRPLVEGVV